MAATKSRERSTDARRSWRRRAIGVRPPGNLDRADGLDRTFEHVLAYGLSSIVRSAHFGETGSSDRDRQLLIGAGAAPPGSGRPAPIQSPLNSRITNRADCRPPSAVWIVANQLPSWGTSGSAGPTAAVANTAAPAAGRWRWLHRVWSSDKLDEVRRPQDCAALDA
jgi:hypothetical protein